MTTAIRIALLTLLVTATGAIAFLGWDAHKFLTSASANSAGLTAILRRVNGPTGPITETDKLLLALKSTTVHADMVIAHEDKQLGKYDLYFQQMAEDVRGTSARAGRTLDSLSGTAHSASATLQTANATIAAAQPVLANLSLTEQASTRTLDSLNARIRDPQLDAIMAHINGMTGSGDKMLADAQEKEHQLLHPTPAKGFKAAVGGAILWLHRIEPPIF